MIIATTLPAAPQVPSGSPPPPRPEAAPRPAAPPGGRRRHRRDPRPGRHRSRVRRLLGRLIRRLVRTVAALLVLVLVGTSTVLACWYARTTVPAPDAMLGAHATVVYYADGRTEIGRFAVRDRVPVRLEQVPRTLRLAVLAAEDQGFEHHHGIAWSGVLRAGLADLRGRRLQGGSTITQQYAKALTARTGRGWRAKAGEAMVALRIERSSDKQQILVAYLNAIYLGRNSYGVQAAARAWFGVDVGRLTLAQSAFLAGIVNGPELYDPDDGAASAADARRRFDVVLDAMVAQGWLDPGTRRQQVFPAVRHSRTPPDPVTAGVADQRGYLMRLVQAELAELHLSRYQLDRDGLTVVTSIDPRLQAATVASAERQRTGTRARGLLLGVLAMDPWTGAVRAVYAGPGELVRARNAATQDESELGTAAAPAVLVAALEHGLPVDRRVPTRGAVRLAGGDLLVNPGGRGHGHPRLDTAAARQWPTALRWIGERAGASAVRAAAVRLGLPAGTRGLDREAEFPLALASPRVVDVALVEATLAAAGRRPRPHLLVRVVEPGGRARSVPVGSTRAVEPGPAGLAADVQIVSALDHQVPEALRRNGFTGCDGPVGTVSGQAVGRFAGWYAGFTPRLAVAVAIHRELAGRALPLVADGGLTRQQYTAVPATVWTDVAAAGCR